MANRPGNPTKHGVGQYIVVAIILGIITYLEFAIVEYDAAWLGDTASLWWLIILSVAKFVMVILFFMHLKDDEAAYSGFFGSGMVIGLGTYVAFVFLMTAPGSLAFVRSQLAPETVAAHGTEAQDQDGGHALPEAVRTLILSDGYSRDLPARLGDVRPKDQSWRVQPPAAPTTGWTLSAAASPAAITTPTESTPDEAETSPEASAGSGGWDEALGEATYSANCASCHQPGGTGIPAAFPPLADHAAYLVGVDGGRTYLIDALLYGLQGPISVHDMSYNGVMPAWAFLSDDQIAAVANHVLHSWDGAAGVGSDFAPIRPDEVAGERDKGLSGTDVHDLRSALDLP